MKIISLFTALFLLVIVSVSIAETQPVPEDADEVVESDGAIEITVEPKPLTHYSPLIAGFGNIIPGLGYFLIDEPWWAVAEYALMGGGLLWGALAAIDPDLNYMFPIIGLGSFLTVYSISLIHAPLLALHKYNQQRVALDLSPGLGLDSEGGAYPTVQLTLSF